MLLQWPSDLLFVCSGAHGLYGRSAPVLEQPRQRLIAAHFATGSERAAFTSTSMR